MDEIAVGRLPKNHRKSNEDKKFLSKNKSIKLYKQKRSKIELLKQEISDLQIKYPEIEASSIKRFGDFPLSERTRTGLIDAGYKVPTDIQRDSIGLALQGHDILGAAKTGSGKTLAFVIPMLERLYCSGWSILDGLGALIITPTRELAYQIFGVLNEVGKHHHFSVALVIGGKDLVKERKLLDKCNILICTPGRLLQHMDENPLFHPMNLKMLILDEADRILDLGFEKTVNAILENLPQDRQTILFSATQTKCVKDLARLSLKNPVYVSVHEHAKYSTPESLKQNFLVCDAYSKMNFIWSFIKSHKQQKVLVFMASCKQVKYTFESICRLKPGISIMALYGSLHQLRRMQIYDDFCRKNHVVMFATDVAARGLDFPNVSWVVQLDCPEDANTYIHRAGRTARYKKNGESLLVLLPSEKESMIKQLNTRKIPIQELKVNPSKFLDVRRKLEATCARDVNLKNSAQRAFKAYLKNIFLMKDKAVFDVTKIDFEKYARSLGLAMAPRIRFLEKHLKLKDMAANEMVNCGSSDSDDDLLKPKETVQSEEEIHELDEPEKLKKPITKAAVAKRILKKKIKANTIIKFDEHGNPIREICGKTVPYVASDLKSQILEEGYSIEKAKLVKEKEEEVDKILFKERIRQKHREERLKTKDKKKKEEGLAPVLSTTEENKDREESSSDEEIDPNDLMSWGQENDVEYKVESSNENSVFYQSNPLVQNSIKRKKSENMCENSKKLKKNVSLLDLHQLLDDEEQLALHYLSMN